MRLLRFLLTAFCLALPAAAMPARAETHMVHADHGIAISGYDPVAYFTSGEAVKGKPAFAVIWKRAEWRFASRRNRALFESNPRAYAPKYGGYCAYSVSAGRLASSDPTAWTIHDGRLYLTHDSQTHDLWARDMGTHVVRADANWPGVLGD